MFPQSHAFLAVMSLQEMGTGGMAEMDIYKIDPAQPLTLAYSEPIERGIITLREEK